MTLSNTLAYYDNEKNFYNTGTWCQDIQQNYTHQNDSQYIAQDNNIQPNDLTN